MAGLFAKAAAKKTEGTGAATAKKAKNTTWLCGSTAGDEVAKAVHELKVLNAEKKAIEAKMDVHKVKVQGYAEDQFYRAYADVGVFPETPMLVQNSDGEKVTFVVQDRSAQYGVKPEQVDLLAEMLGQDAVGDLLYEETTIAFNRLVMALPGVTEAVEQALERAIMKLVKDGSLSEEQAGELVDPIVKRTFKPGTLDRLAIICGRDVTRIEQFCEIMGSSCTMYLKA